MIGNTHVRIIKGDITDQTTMAVVNAANSSLMGGGGVDGAIHRKGGPKILEECKLIRRTKWSGGLPPGRAVSTTGGNLTAQYVIHTVGPVWHGGKQGEPKLLAEAYRNSAKLAISMGLKSIAFPSISTGAYGFPIDKASEIALRTMMELVKAENGLDEVVFVLFSKTDLEIYEKKAGRIFREE